jgi:hypothetical protein
MWLGDLPVEESAGGYIAYKFVVVDSDGTAVYENRPAHFRRLPDEGFLDLKERWS